MDKGANEPLLDIYVFETLQMLEQLEQSVLNSETNGFESSIDEIFRAMHSIKGSSAMMLFDNIAHLAHGLEDMFDYLRNCKPKIDDYSGLTDLVLESIDFIKIEVVKIQEKKESDGQEGSLIEKIEAYLNDLKKSSGNTCTWEKSKDNEPEENQKYYVPAAKSEDNDIKKNKYSAVIFFEDDCQMENLRAFAVIQSLKGIAADIKPYPDEAESDDKSIEIIRREGFKVIFSTNLNLEEIKFFLSKTVFLRELQIELIQEIEESAKSKVKKQIILDDIEDKVVKKENTIQDTNKVTISNKQTAISVNIEKLDLLMDLVGELVISEEMVTQHPELADLELDGFYKAARQLKKISNELQDAVMSIRMVPLSMTFQKMTRLVRDMSHKLNKEVELEIIGEETEVDKNIIENISDPLMHIIRNSIDHGIESTEERVEKGKLGKGKVTLEAKNSGGDVWIIVRDDGRGLEKEKILQKAREKNLLTKPESELTEKEIYNLIFLPGFSTNDEVTEFSGRGVGMDVVVKNVEKIRGMVQIDSKLGEGTTIAIKIPLTLAIVDGMNIAVGESKYTIPITSVKESLKIKNQDVIHDPDGNEMMMIRGECYPLIRLHKLYKIDTNVTNLMDGIVIMVEEDEKAVCLFADELIGEQQAVVKALPKYIKKVKGIAGCTLLGDGGISLILDVATIVNI